MADREGPSAFDREPGDEPLFIATRETDPAMQAAYRRAHETLPLFRSLIESRQGDNVYHSAKLRFRDPGESERLGEDSFFFLWLSFVTIEDGFFAGTFVEVPATMTAWLHEGGSRTFESDDIFDWMVNDHGEIHGGFTLRVARAAIPEAERAQYDRYVGAECWVPDA